MRDSPSTIFQQSLTGLSKSGGSKQDYTPDRGGKYPPSQHGGASPIPGGRSTYRASRHGGGK